ncbi:MAG: hypothetical protein LBT53_04170 [Puniceicoccales bacterium]|jgi:hypothetical protein|nr:hypothetical protein [Puniceicoccales bacterium]
MNTQHPHTHTPAADDMEYPQGWKTLAGDTTPAAAAATALRRRRRANLERLAILGVFVAFAGLVAFAFAKMVVGDDVPVSPVVVSFKSYKTRESHASGKPDGTLTKEWFLERAGMQNSRRASVTQINNALAGVAQIKEVVKNKRHSTDDGVDVEVLVRRPVFRLAYPPSKPRETLIVADDGVLFRGINLDSVRRLASLPLLEGVKDAHITLDKDSNAVLRAPASDKSGKHWGIIGSLPCAVRAAEFVKYAEHVGGDRLTREWESVSVAEFAGGDPDVENICLRVRPRLGKRKDSKPRIVEIQFSAATDAFRRELHLYADADGVFSKDVKRNLDALATRPVPVAGVDADYVLCMFYGHHNPTGGADRRAPRLIHTATLIPESASRNLRQNR